MRSGLLERWQPGPGEWDRAAAAHLYRRAGFGARAEELEQAVSEGPQATLERLFRDGGDTELRAAIRPLLAASELEDLQAWWMALILEGEAPLRERMALVWHDHFATSNDKVDDVRLMHAQNELFRTQGLGDFRALLVALARDPAMLRWLDGDSNRSGHPNENLAREVLELFALGRGHYDEHDVRELARALSGRGTSGRSFVFRPEHHDAGDKTILGHTGPWDGDQALELVLRHPACANHVARTLLEAFVVPAPGEDLVGELAQVLLEAEWNVERTLRVLLASRLFFSPAARRARIASPVELVAVAARSLGVRFSPKRAARLASEMGQALFRPPSVKGWEGGRAWIHSGSWIARHNALVALVESDGARADLAGPDVDELARRALDELLPEGACEDHALALRRAARAARDVDGARRAVVALVLTSPEFQLF